MLHILLGISILHVSAMITVVCLEDGHLVACTPPNSITCAHNVSQLVHGLEDVDANALIKAGGLEQPQILMIMTTISQLEWCLDRFFFAHLVFLKLFIHFIDIIVFMFVNDLMDLLEDFYLLADVVLKIVQNYCQREHFVNIELLRLVVKFHIEEQIILRCQLAMSFDMVYQLF